ncbi:uncharacterized protein LOC127791792 [Diospyros lotus]|uniref:uncharacterized protein LOC127791792 n=1 Tax=Diospyros lotus TaxID=55363 RepID=UPI0022592E4E|nr:uncharacterized protein LOC127791792 [Diospyros lotus]
MLQSQQFLSRSFPFFLSHPHNPSLSPHSLNFLYRHNSITLPPNSVQIRTGNEPMLAQTSEPAADGPEDGPIEIPPSVPSIFADSDNPSPLQVSTSLLLTGAISVFLFRSLRRRAKRAKELKFRSSGAKKSLKEEAMESLKVMTPAPPKGKGPPSPVQALLGGLSAGVIALILYKFTTTIEASLNRQTLSDNFSVRQITITIRTIVNGLCYLATFVFGINSVGLFLYSAQLALNSFMDDSSSKNTENNGEAQLSSNQTTKAPTESFETGSSNEDQNSGGVQ